MVKTNYANAYKEVLVVINNLIKEDYNKIPKEYIEFLTANCSNDYNFEYDYSKNFQEQELLEETKYILFGLFEKFGATENQKEKIKIFKKNYYNKKEEEKRQIYNTDNLFKKQTIIENEEYIEQKNEEKMLMVVEKENIFKRIINKIKKYFTKNKS